MTAQIPTLVAGEVRNGAVSFAARLDEGELLTGVPTVTEETTTDLTIDNVGRNGSQINVLGQAVAANQAVLFRVAGAVAGRLYILLLG